MALSHVIQPQTDADADLLETMKVREAFKRLCDMPWPPALAASIVSAFRSAHLPQEHIEVLMTAAYNVCGSLPPEDLADTAYAMLTLPATPNTQHLATVCKLFTELKESAAAAELGDLEQVNIAQSAFLFKVKALFSRDKHLANQWFKAFKGLRKLDSFALSLTLTIVAVNRSSAAALDALKKAFSTILKNGETLEQSSWLASLPCEQLTARMELARTLHDVVNSADEHLATQLVQLGFHLMASGKLKQVQLASLRRVEADDYSGLSWYDVPCGVPAKLALSGVAILEQVRMQCNLVIYLERFKVVNYGNTWRTCIAGFTSAQRSSRYDHRPHRRSPRELSSGRVSPAVLPPSLLPHPGPDSFDRLSLCTDPGIASHHRGSARPIYGSTHICSALAYVLV
jgi:hypothetical protein